MSVNNNNNPSPLAMSFWEWPRLIHIDDVVAKLERSAVAANLKVVERKRLLSLFSQRENDFTITKEFFELVSSCFHGQIGSKEWLVSLREVLKENFFWGPCPAAYAPWKQAKKNTFLVRIGNNPAELCLVVWKKQGFRKIGVEETIVFVQAKGFQVKGDPVVHGTLNSVIAARITKCKPREGCPLGGVDCFQDQAAAAPVVVSVPASLPAQSTLADFFGGSTNLDAFSEPAWAGFVKGALNFADSKALEVVVGKLNGVDWGQIANGIQGFAGLAGSVASAMGPFGAALAGVAAAGMVVVKVIELHVTILKNSHTARLLLERLQRFQPSLVALQRSMLESFQRTWSQPLESALQSIKERVSRLGPCVKLVTDMTADCEQLMDEWELLNDKVRDSQWLKKILPVLKRATSAKGFEGRFVEVEQHLDKAQQELNNVLIIDVALNSADLKRCVEEALGVLKQATSPSKDEIQQVVQREHEALQLEIRAVFRQNDEFRMELLQTLDTNQHTLVDLIGLGFGETNEKLDLLTQLVIRALNKDAPPAEQLVDKVEVVKDWKGKPSTAPLSIANLKPFNGDKVQELDQLVLQVDGTSSSFGAKGVLEYARKKALALEIIQETGFPLVIVGCWFSTADAFVKAQGWQNVKDRTTAEMRKNADKTYNCYGPLLWECKAEEGVAFLFMVVPPGRDIVKCYGQAHKLLVPQEYSVRAFYIPALMTPTRFREFTQLDTLKDHIKDSIVIIGAVKTLRSHFKKEGKTIWWKVNDSDLDNPFNDFWGYSLLESKTDKTRVLFLGARASFWGNIAYTLAQSLFELGAKELIHAGMKVGTLVDKEAIREGAIYPGTFYLINEKGDVQEFPARNSLAETVKYSDAPHVSVGSPLDESKQETRVWKKRFGGMTVDDEGAYMARAAEEWKRKFGALYFASDYVLAIHENNIDNELGNALSAAEKAKEAQVLQQISESLWMHVTPRSALPFPALDVLRKAMVELQPRCWTRMGETLTFDKFNLARSLHHYVEKYAPGSPKTHGPIKSVSLEDCLELPRKGSVFLLNEAGSGKSQYLAQLAWSWAKGEQKALAGHYDAIVYVSLSKSFDPTSKGKDATEQLAALVKRNWNLNLDALAQRKVLWLFDDWEEALAEFGSNEALFVEFPRNPAPLNIQHAIISMRPSSFLDGTYSCRAAVMLGDLSDSAMDQFAKLLGHQQIPARLKMEPTREAKPEKPTNKDGALRSLCRIPMFLELFCFSSDLKCETAAELLLGGLREHLKELLDVAIRAAATNEPVPALVEKGLQIQHGEKKARWVHDLVRSFLFAASLLALPPLPEGTNFSSLTALEWQFAIELMELPASTFITDPASVLEAQRHLLLLPNESLEKIRAQALYEASDSKFVASLNAACLKLPRTIDLCLGMANLWDRVGMTKKAVPWLQEAKKLLGSSKIPPHVALTFGWISFHLDEWDASIEVLKQALPHELESVSPLDIAISRPLIPILNLLGEVLQRKNDFEQAEYYLRAAGQFIDSLEPNSPEEQEMLKNIAWVLREQGERKLLAKKPDNAGEYFVEAMANYDRALQIADLCFGRDHLKYGTVLRHMGSTERDLARATTSPQKRTKHLDAAVAYYKQAFDIKMCVLQREHPEVATIDHELGKVLHLQGDFPAALELIERATKNRLLWLGSKDVNYARSLHAKGDVLMDMEKLDEADECFVQSKKIYEDKKKLDTDNAKELLESIKKLEEKKKAK